MYCRFVVKGEKRDSGLFFILLMQRPTDSVLIFVLIGITVIIVAIITIIILAKWQKERWLRGI